MKLEGKLKQETWAGVKPNIEIQDELGTFPSNYVAAFDAYSLPSESNASLGNVVIFGTRGSGYGPGLMEQIREGEIHKAKPRAYGISKSNSFDKFNKLFESLMTPGECFDADTTESLLSLQEIQAELNPNLIADILAVEKLKKHD